MAQPKITVLDLIDLNLEGHNSLNIHCIAGRKGLSRVLSEPDINRPGLALSGFYENYAYQRVQLFGRGEYAYLNKLETEQKFNMIEEFFKYQMPCVVFTNNLQPSESILAMAEAVGCPILQTSLESTEFSQRLLRVFSELFAPKITRHGVFVEVFGIGIFLTGSSGIGKSETALELVERGHRLVADDLVSIKCVNGNILMGMGENTSLNHHMEIRGLGIIDVSQLYGVGAIREQKEVQLVVNLYDKAAADKKRLEMQAAQGCSAPDTKLESETLDRLGQRQYTEYLGVKVPILNIPVTPGRNLPIIIEAAAMNERLKSMGYSSAKEFTQNIMKWMEKGQEQSFYNSKTYRY